MKINKKDKVGISGQIVKSHKEGKVTVIEEFKLMSVSVIQSTKNPTNGNNTRS